MTHNWNYKAKQAAAYISNKFLSKNFTPSVFMVLGSGFRDCVENWEVVCEIPMHEIPSYPTPNVAGHGSKILGVKIRSESNTCRALIATGRVHLYEGYTPFEVCLPVFIAHELGIKNIVLTNAAGQLTNSASVGTIVAISDHLNLTGQNVACITPKSRPIQFVDMAGAYNSHWTKAVCDEMNLSSGVYAGMLGPTFESPAEAKMLKILGADLAGMSTVQEAIAARMNGQNVFACSFVTNVAGGASADHGDVLKSVKTSANHIQKTMEAVLKHAPSK